MDGTGISGGVDKEQGRLKRVHVRAFLRMGRVKECEGHKGGETVLKEQNSLCYPRLQQDTSGKLA